MKASLWARCDNISHYLQNDQWIDGETNQQIHPERKESLVTV